MCELEGVQALQLGQREEPSTFNSQAALPLLPKYLECRRPLATANLTKFVVTLKEGVHPYCQPPRTEPPYKRERIPPAFRKCLEAGIYEPRESPRGAPVVLVSRPGNEANDRLCADYRELDKRTLVPRYPLLRIQQALDALQGKAYFSLFDFPSAYYQVGVEERSRPVLAFQAQEGHTQPTRMPLVQPGLRHPSNEWLITYSLA
ncbi:hypothetical protein Efla_003586 [Eimeria flavescens]